MHLIGSMVCRYSGGVATFLLLFLEVILGAKGGEGVRKTCTWTTK